MATEITLTKGYMTTVDDIDADLTRYKWHAHIGNTGRVYARRTKYANGKKAGYFWIHRVIAERLFGGLFIHGMDIDHIDNNPLNNRRENLRITTQGQNLQNSGTQKRQIQKGILKGARFHKRDHKWSSSIKIDGKLIHLGTFDTMEEAHDAYCEAARKYHGEFARFE